MDFASEIPPLGRSPAIHCILEAAACPSRFLQGRPPVAVKLHELSAVHEAAAGKSEEVWLLLAPPRQGRRPLPCTANLVDLFTRQDHAAVNDSGDDRRNLPRRYRHHCLVQDAETLAHVAVRDEERALHVRRKGKEVSVAETFAGLRCRRGRSGGTFVVAGSLVLQGDR